LKEKGKRLMLQEKIELEHEKYTKGLVEGLEIDDMVEALGINFDKQNDPLFDKYNEYNEKFQKPAIYVSEKDVL